MVFPIGDDNVQGGSFPMFSYAFIALNIAFWFYQLTDPAGLLVCDYGVLPNNIVNGKDYFTLFTSMFMHGGWMHIIGNMLFLWVFADNIEATVGNFNFFIFYILGGLFASAAHIYFSVSPDVTNCCMPCGGGTPCELNSQIQACSGWVPSIGASGAISACLGAYLVMFPKSKVKILVVYFFKSFRVPAILFLGFWAGQQFLSGFMSLAPGAATTGTAWWAHIGGFVFGVVAGYFARNASPGVKQARETYAQPNEQDFV